LDWVFREEIGLLSSGLLKEIELVAGEGVVVIGFVGKRSWLPDRGYILLVLHRSKHYSIHLIQR
jgi:hypothetical protein